MHQGRPGPLNRPSSSNTSAATPPKITQGQTQNRMVSTNPVAAQTLEHYTLAASSPISVINNYSDMIGQEASIQATQSTARAESTTPLGAVNTRDDAYSRQNQQHEKTAFLKATQTAPSSDYIQSRLQHPISPFQLMAGTIIPATLLSGINTDIPGEMMASVSRNLYDSTTGNILLLPQGTKVIGQYDSQVAYGQTRVLIAWTRLLFPNGTSFNLNGMPGVDLAGLAGLHDQVDNHYMRIFGSTLMFSMFGALGQLSQPQQQSNVLSNQQIIYGAIGQQLSQTGAQLVQKNMNIQPTLKIRPGANFNILLTRDMVLPHGYRS